MKSAKHRRGSAPNTGARATGSSDKHDGMLGKKCCPPKCKPGKVVSSIKGANQTSKCCKGRSY